MSSGSNAPERQSASEPPARSTLEAGRTTLGKYQIVRQLGAGGMGTVYLAVDTQLKRTVALKVLPKDRTENDTLVRRFEAEAQAAAQLRHENIITVYDAGRIDGHLFISLEFVEGDDIYDRVAKRGSLPLKRSIDFVKQVARALEHLHKRGYVHRDIKPSNLLVTKEGIVKLTDMGLARAVDESLRSNITREGTTVGTVDYMAPEQARDSQAADIRSDIYSLGCTWYQMLTGEPPFPTGSVTNKLFAHISKARPDPRALNSSIPEEVVAVMHRMMARKPADRYQTPAELLRDLDQLGTGRSRLDEVLGPDGVDDLPATPTPARGTPTLPPPSLPPRQIPGRTRAASNNAEEPTFDPPQPPPKLPARTLPPGVRHEPLVRPAAGSRRADGDDSSATPARGTPVRAAAALGAKRPARPTLVIDWQALAIRGSAVLGTIAVIGLFAWLGRSYFGGDSRLVAARKAADSQADPNPADVPADDAKNAAAQAKSGAEKKAARQNAKKTAPPIMAKKVDEKPVDRSPVRGRPGERTHFPAWITEVWDPHAARDSAGPAPKTVTVGRVGADRADCASLSSAIERLPEEGGVIEVRGTGPFVLPALKIANRGHVVITGAASGGAGRTPGPELRKPAGPFARPLIVIVPAAGAPSDSGILASETSLTLYGVDLVAFADEFASDSAVRIVDVRSGDLIVRDSSLTLVGGRGGATSAFCVSGQPASAERPPRVLFDRTVVRGRDLAAVDADVRSIDMLAINSLFVTGKAPVLNLQAGQAATASGKEPRILRTVRIFSCTTCTDDSAVSLRAGSDQANAPATRFHVMNSVFGIVFQAQSGAMIALNNWPVRPVSAESHAPVENLTWASESFVVRGWQHLVQADSGAQFGIKDGGAWATFWGEPHSTFLYDATPFSAIGEFDRVAPARFKTDAAVSTVNAAGDTAPPGCDAAILSTPVAGAVARADALSRRPRIPLQFQEGAPAAGPIKEVDLESTQWHDLGKFINQLEWKSGTRFVVHGSGKKTCGPIRVHNKSLSIEFADSPPPLVQFEVPSLERGKRDAYISVTGGTIEIINARFQIKPTVQQSPHWLLDASGGSFSLRDCLLLGPTHENPGYEGLLHFGPAAGHSGADGGRPLWAHIRNSVLLTNRSAVCGDMTARCVNVENSILAADGRVFDLQLPPASPVPPTIDLRRATIAAGGECFRVDTSGGAGRVRIFAEDSIFGPPLKAQGGSAKPPLIGGTDMASIPRQFDWWEYGCAYSSLRGLPYPSGQAPAAGSDPLSGWQDLMGPWHIVRSTADLNAVVFPRSLPPAKETAQSDFRLRPETAAATWSDVGTAVGATLPDDLLPPAKEPVGGKKAPAKKTARSAGGI